MKKPFLGVFVLILFFVTGYCAEQKADPYMWDFGQVKEGKVVKHTFILKNDGHKTLTIKEVHTSCGCTASEIKQKVLRPRENSSLNVSFNSKGYRGEAKQFVYVNTDDIDKPVIRFIIKAQVVK